MTPSVIFESFNNSRIAWGLGTVLMQLGARYVIGDLTEMQNRILGTLVAKRVVLCFMIFVATRDIMIAVALTAAIHAILTWLFNEKSGLCIVPRVLHPVTVPAAPATSQAKDVSKDQYEAALITVQRYRDAHGLVRLDGSRRRYRPNLLRFGP